LQGRFQENIYHRPFYCVESFDALDAGWSNLSSSGS